MTSRLGAVVRLSIVAALVVVTVAVTAQDSPAADCGTAFDVPTCEAVNEAVAELTNVKDRLDTFTDEDGSGVALSDAEEGRLDLIWWGSWLMPGLTVGLLAGARFWRHMEGWFN